ncbi:MAG: phage terminase large subunit, partial [Nitrospirae bacterium]|nr:phage terminase large subunit [Nitrospirota bacterium]
QQRFVFSDATINAIVSGFGEGKTFAGIVSMIYHAQRNGAPIHCAIIRDTHENIKTSTAKSIQQELGSYAKFRNDYKALTIMSNPQVTCDLFGIDDPASLGKLQGPEYALIWLEEPAPMSEKANAGLSEEVFNAALARCARQKGCIPRLQITMNPADKEHWTYRRLIEAPDVDPDFPLITKAVFFIPYGENVWLGDMKRQAVKAAYKHDIAGRQRYIEGKFADVYRGKKVTPEYNPELHLSRHSLAPAEGLVSFRAFDSWFNPACLVGQITTTGRLIFIDELRAENCDIRTFVDSQVKPLMESPRWKDKARAWRDIGDISMKQPDQSNINESAAKVIEKAFGTYFEGGPKQWGTMKDRMKYALNRNFGGLPAIVIGPECYMLDKALAGAWHLKTDTSGNIIRSIPEKNDAYSHIGDCFANAVSVLLPLDNMNFDTRFFKVIQQKLRTRAAAYA